MFLSNSLIFTPLFSLYFLQKFFAQDFKNNIWLAFESSTRVLTCRLLILLDATNSAMSVEQ